MKKFTIKSIEKKISAYSALATGVIAISSSANAQIIYTNVDPDLTIHEGSYFLDFNRDSINDFELTQASYYNTDATWGNVGITALDENEVMAVQSGMIIYPFVLNKNDTIEGQQNLWESGNDNMILDGFYYYSTGSFSSQGYWSGAKDKYLGLRIKVSGQWHYGWARLDVDSNTESFTIKDFAYQSTPEQAILAGQLPITDEVSNVQAADIGNSGNGSDMEVTCTKANDEAKVSEYRIIIVKSADASTFNLEAANAVTAGNYTSVIPTGSDLSDTLSSAASDKDGNLIQNDIAYKVFVLSIADGNNAVINAISQESSGITLVNTSSINRDEQKNGEIDVYSSGGSIYVKGHYGQNLKGTITIFNSLGNEIHKSNVNSNNKTISFSNMPHGVYIVKVQYNKKIFSKKLFLK